MYNLYIYIDLLKFVINLNKLFVNKLKLINCDLILTFNNKL